MKHHFMGDRFPKKENAMCEPIAEEAAPKTESDASAANSGEYRRVTVYTRRDPEESEQYGLTISVDFPSREVLISDSVLFDRETYEEFTASLFLKKEELEQFLARCASEDGTVSFSAENGTATAKVEDGFITHLEVFSRGYSGGRTVRISVRELQEQLKEAGF